VFLINVSNQFFLIQEVVLREEIESLLRRGKILSAASMLSRVAGNLSRRDFNFLNRKIAVSFPATKVAEDVSTFCGEGKASAYRSPHSHQGGGRGHISK
jgi:hypothetical protein